MWTSIHFSRLIIIPPYSYHSSADLTNAAANPLRKMKQFIPHHVKYQQDINAGGTGRVADTVDFIYSLIAFYPQTCTCSLVIHAYV
jgi:hypothetical protein